MIPIPERPRNVDAERGLLSCLVKDGNYMADALDQGVNEYTFTTPLLIEIWNAMVAVDKNKEAINEVSLLQHLGDKTEDLGKKRIWEVFDACGSSTFFHKYLESSKESERLRTIQSLAMNMLDKVKDKENSLDLAEKADRSLFLLNRQAGGLLDGESVAEEAWKGFLEARKQGGKNGTSTGLDKLDTLLGGGLRKRSLTILAARPSTGKTALALQLCAEFMGEHGVYFQSLEMNAESLGKRMIGHLSGVSIQAIERGRLDNLQDKSVNEAMATLKNGYLQMDDKGGASMALCRAKARRVKNLGLVVIDYCGLVTPSDSRVPREQQIAGISKDSKLLAEELDCPVVLVAQLNRSSEQLAREPRLSDLRESGALEQDADNVMMLYQPNMENREKISLLLAKNRFGQTGYVNLHFDRFTQTFEDADSRSKEGYRSPFIS